MTLVCISGLAWLGPCWVTGDAKAYCVSEGIAGAILDEFPGRRIPVYLAYDGSLSIEHIGLPTIDAARTLIEVIARHNETSAPIKLHFAGFRNVEFMLSPDDDVDPGEVEARPHGLWPKGIVVHSFGCDDLLSDPDNNKFRCHADAQVNHGCANVYINNEGQLVGVVALLPDDCEHTVTTAHWSMTQTPYDVAATMLHELGHVLGLQHSNRSVEVCNEGGYVASNDPEGNTGVMSSPQSGLLEVNRHWRRDDLDGIEHLYGEDAPIYETALWSDDLFPDYPPLPSNLRVSGTAVRRTAALGGDTAGNLTIVSVDEDQRVIAAIMAADGSLTQPYEVVDPSPHGRTWGSPAIATGTGMVDGATRELVAWTADEPTTSSLMTIRWAIREAPGGAWGLVDGFETRGPRLTAGFDPTTSTFLIATLSAYGQPELALVDLDGELLAAGLIVTEDIVFELANVLCDAQVPACTMLFASSADGGSPSLGRIDFAVDADALSLLGVGVETYAGQDVLGRLGLAPAGVGAARGVAGWRRYGVALDEFDPPWPQPMPPFALHDWSLGLGAYREGGDDRHRLTMPVVTACGNGVVEVGEDCDDGNHDGADDCGAACLFEEPVGTDEGGTGYGYDAGLDEDEDCECRVGRGLGHGGGPWLVALALLLGVRPRPR